MPKRFIKRPANEMDDRRKDWAPPFSQGSIVSTHVTFDPHLGISTFARVSDDKWFGMVLFAVIFKNLTKKLKEPLMMPRWISL